MAQRHSAGSDRPWPAPSVQVTCSGLHILCLWQLPFQFGVPCVPRTGSRGPGHLPHSPLCVLTTTRPPTIAPGQRDALSQRQVPQGLPALGCDLLPLIFSHLPPHFLDVSKSPLPRDDLLNDLQRFLLLPPSSQSGMNRSGGYLGMIKLCDRGWYFSTFFFW